MEYNYKLTSPNIIRISKSGNVGIGTTTPNASLYINSPIDDGEIRIKPKNFEIRNCFSVPLGEIVQDKNLKAFISKLSSNETAYIARPTCN